MASLTNAWREENVKVLIEVITSGVMNKNWTEVLDLCEKLEMILCTTESGEDVYATSTSTNNASCCFDRDMGKYVALHLISLYITGNLCEAKFRWKRIPSQSIYKTDENSEVARCWEFGKSLWTKDKRALSTMQNALDNNSWSNLVKDALVALIEKERMKQYHLTVKAYSSISVETFAAHMGLSPQDAETMALNKGWTVSDGSDNMDCENKSEIQNIRMLVPDKLSRENSISKSQEVRSEQLERLAKYVAFLTDSRPSSIPKGAQ